MKIIKNHSVFLVLILSCAVLRLIPLFQYQFTFDELSGLDRTHYNLFSEMLEKGVKELDTHPALIQILIYYLTKLFGYTEWTIKLPFLLFGFGAVLFGYAFGLRNFSKQSALLISSFLSFSLIFVFYAPIARMYISGVFFSIGLLYFFFEIFFQKSLLPMNFLWLGTFSLVCALNQHLNALFAFSLMLSGFLFLSKENSRKFLLTVVLAIIAYAPHLPITLYQLNKEGIGINQGGWLDKPNWFAGLEFIKVLLGSGYVYIVFFVFLILSLVINKTLKIEKKQWLLLAIFLINYFIIYFYSVFRAAIYQNSVMLFSGVGMLVFLISLLNEFPKMIFYFVFSVLTFVLIYTTYIQKNYFSQSVLSGFDVQVKKTMDYKNKYGPNHVFPFYFETELEMKDFYFKKYNTSFPCITAQDSLLINKQSFDKCVSNLKADYIILSDAFPIHWAVTKKYFPYLIENIQTQNINFKLYSRIKVNLIENAEDDKTLNVSNPIHQNDFVYRMLNNYSSGKFSIDVNSSNEFPFPVQANYNKVFTKSGEVLLIHSKIKVETKNYEGTELCISVNDKKSNESFGYTGMAAGDFVLNPDSTIDIYANYFAGSNFSEIKYKATISSYLWNKSEAKFKILDFNTRCIDYRPLKWHFWD